jgi:hypothetical protein
MLDEAKTNVLADNVRKVEYWLSHIELAAQADHPRALYSTRLSNPRRSVCLPRRLRDAPPSHPHPQDALFAFER